MFKNPLKKYQQGGSTPTEEQQKLLAAFIEWLPKRVKEFQGMQPEAIAQALDGMSKTPEGQKQVQQLMEQFQQEVESGTQAFKQGGKIRDFICKHAKGGVTDCGCSRKMENGGPTSNLNFIERMYDGDGNAVYIMARERRHLPSNMRSDPNSEYQQQGGEYQGNGQVSIVDFGNGKLRINSDPYGPYGNVLHGADSAAYANRALELMKKIGMKPSTGFVQSNQEGGELTRKEALRLGRKNKGYNRAQARLAYQNAKNSIRSQGGKGREMRQTARQWVAGEMNKPTTAWWQNVPQVQVELPITEQITPEEQAYINEVFERSLARPYTGNFNQAFANARKDGRSLFLWNNNPYTTELAKSKASQVDFNSLPEDIQNNLTGNVVVEIPNVEISDLPENYISLQENNFDKYVNGENLRLRINNLFRGNNSTIPVNGIVYKQGGKVEKAQEGATIEPYYNSNPINEWIKNKFNNNSTLYRLQQGFQNFKESAPGKVLSFFIPNPNSETGMLSAAAPIGKIKSYRTPTQKVLYEKEPLAKTIKEGMLPEYNIPKYNKGDYDIDKMFNTDNFINNIDLSNLIEKNTFSKRFIKYLKNDVLPHTDTDWLKYGLGSIGGATAEAALIKYMQNKENKQSSKNKK